MKQLFIGLIILCTAMAATAQKTVAGNKKSLLWRISGNGLKEPAYLFGTCHLLCASDYFFPATIDTALHSCRELCLEMDISNQAETGKIMLGMRDTTGRKLRDYFTTPQYAGLETFFNDSIKMPLSLFESMKPQALLGVIESYALGCGTDIKSYESDLVAKANAYQISVAGFENAAQMLTLLNQIPPDTVINSIVRMMHGQDELRRYNCQIIQAYKGRDIDQVYQIVHESGALGASELLLIDERNTQWIPAMVRKMQQHAVFFAVGAGHLGGAQGLISQLRQKGYILSPVQ